MTAEELMLTVADTLARTGIPCMLVGPFASSYHGIPRSTEDADFLLQIDDFPASAISAGLGPCFRLDPQSSLETFTTGTFYTVKHVDTDFTIDLFLMKGDPHDESSFKRKLLASYAGTNVFVPTPEDVIITKLRWSQEGRRTKDINDVLGVISVQTPEKLDLPYIRYWIGQHGTRELFEQLLARAPRID